MNFVSYYTEDRWEMVKLLCQICGDINPPDTCHSSLRIILLNLLYIELKHRDPHSQRTGRAVSAALPAVN